MATDPEAEREYARIDPIQSVSEMTRAVDALPSNLRRCVIYLGLARSRFQWWWSLLARKHGIPPCDWPDPPGTVLASLA